MIDPSLRFLIVIYLLKQEYIPSLQSMQDHDESSSNTAQTAFTKGMSLQQYMSRANFLPAEGESQTEDPQEQNLYESSVNHLTESGPPKKSQYLIDDIDEESAEDSIQYRNEEYDKGQFKQVTKETLRPNNETPDFNFRPKINSISMNATAYLKHSSNEKGSFRIKHISMSPYKKNEVPAQNGSITLYGTKFGQATGKTETKIPQLVTFYGKIQHQKEEIGNRKSSFKKGDSKRNFKKKSHLEINELIEFQNRIKNNYSQKGYYQDMRVQGIKDKLAERKSRLC